ncbi:MAG: GNAT family N-acetyltransferase [Oscillospiraceae bacterium]|nr:GNAT family N-acetyltransferase [Oscillospiraceae bacterium]
MKLLADWLSDPGVLEYVYGEGAPWDTEKVKRVFGDKTEDGGGEAGCFIVLDGKEIGYMQYYPIREDSYKFNDRDTYIRLKPGFGIDMFIGKPELWDKGIGSRAVGLITEYLKNTYNIPLLCADPETGNARAVHFFQKVGFERIDIVENYDDRTKQSFLTVKNI